MKKLRKVGCILLMVLLAGLFANCRGALVLIQAQTNSLISQKVYFVIFRAFIIGPYILSTDNRGQKK